jgi:transposase
MYVESVPNRNSPPAVLLRESRREDGKIVKRTLANLSDWPAAKIESLRRLLRDELLVDPHALFQTHQTLPHGHVEAVLMMMQRLGVESILASQPGRERDLVMAMIAERVLHPCSKLATVRDWHTTTLAEQFSVQDATEDELYLAMDWLLERKERIEKKLAARHLKQGSFVLYDASSSYYEGHTCPLAKFGYGRDGKKGLPIIVYGVLTDPQGCPLAVEVYPGNTADPTTVIDQANKLADQFGLSQVVLVADRGMLTQPQIEKLKTHAGFGWVTALTSVAIRELVAQNDLQLSLLDETNLAEITSSDYPGERLMVCRNPLLAEERARKRRELLESTEKQLDKISKQVARRTSKPLLAAEIGLKVGKILGRYKMAKHFDCTIDNGTFGWSRREESIQKEASLDGIYVIRTSEPAERLSSEDTVRTYKSLAQVERAFRSLKGIDLMVRPIRHRKEDRVKAHIFLCMLAYYVQWHMLQAWAPLLFADQELPEMRKLRDPILPATISESAKDKKETHQTQDGLPVHSFASLMDDLATRVRVTYGLKSDTVSPTFQQVPQPSPLQARAYQLLASYPVAGN